MPLPEKIQLLRSQRDLAARVCIDAIIDGFDETAYHYARRLYRIARELLFESWVISAW